MPPRELTEPLLRENNNNQQQQQSDNDVESPNNNIINNNSNNADECPCPPEGQNSSDNEGRTSSSSSFSKRTELWEMWNLGFPLAVSFFCRMGMASTDSSFVGHIRDGTHTPELYLAAAVLSDMVVTLLVTPPLAFNQVLNALVGQAMGSNNPKMAGIWLQQSMGWLAITMLPCLVGCFYVEPILRLLDFAPDVAEVAGQYAKYNLLWPVPNGLYQCMRFYFQAQGLPRPAMYNNILFLFVNALLNWIFVFGGPIPRWDGFGFIGAAISLSISRTLQPIVYYLYMFVYKQHHLTTWPDDGWSLRHHTWSRTKEFLSQALPNIGTLLFQTCAGQATTVLVGRLGQRAIAASSALSTVTIPWSGTLSATCTTISGVRVGYHLGRGDGRAAQQSTWLVLQFMTVIIAIVSVLFVPLGDEILKIATDDDDVISLSAILIPAMLVGTYLNLLVSNITSGVFSGMGRPIISTILSFGFELPTSIGGAAIYILAFHGNLLGVYWWTAISAAIEIVVVLGILLASDWDYWASEARRRQEAGEDTTNNNNDDDDDGNGNNDENEEQVGLLENEPVPDDDVPDDDDDA